MIEMVPEDEYRTLLTLRYLLNKQWKEITKDLNYSRSHVLRKHLKALNSVYDYIKESEEDET